MFAISEAEAAAIRAVFRERGEFAAAIELRQLVPRNHRQRAGAGVRSDHRRLAAAAQAATLCETALAELMFRRMAPTLFPLPTQ
jgi:hypothetical protein